MWVSTAVLSVSSDHIYPSGGFSSNRVNWVKPVQESDKPLDPSIFQKSSMRRSCLTSNFVLAVLLSEWSLTLGSTWWRYMKFPDMDQKSFIASPASGSESWGGGRDPSDSPTKSTWPSPWIGCSRIKVDVLSSWSPPAKFIRPSATGKWIFHFLWVILLPVHCVFQSRFLMRPSFPTSQCLQLLSHPSKFPPCTRRIRETIQVRLSFQIDGFLTGLSQK